MPDTNKPGLGYHFNFVQQCRDEGLSLWECPPFLFTFTGLISILSMGATYFVTSLFFSLEIVIIIISITAGIMAIISYLVNQGSTKVAEARKVLAKTNTDLRRALDEVRRAEKMREDFTTMLVHDLRSPLQAVRLILEMFQQRKKVPSAIEFEESMRAMSLSTANMLNLISNLLDIAKFERGKFAISKKPGSLPNVITQVMESYRILAESKRIELSATLSDNITPVPFDEYALNRALANLIANAVKFTPAQGHVTVQAVYCPNGREIDELAKRYRFTWFLTKDSPFIKNVKNSVIVAVSDTGIGIAREKIDTLFLSFSQVAVAQSSIKIGIPLGTGLGLAITKTIVEAHGGIIHVASKEQKGSTFYFSLPVH